MMNKMIEGRDLSRGESRELFAGLADLVPEEQAKVLEFFKNKKETPEEIVGALDYLETRSVPVDCPYDVVDIVGTGGDGIGAFNISTTASFVLASCGVYVAKHGGRGATSKAGSMDVLDALGLAYAKNAGEVIESLEKTHYAYLWAGQFNPEFRKFAEVRRQLGYPTIFNVLGPLLNPTKPKRQVVGVYRRDLVKIVAEVLLLQGAVHSLVVNSDDGMDELSISAPSVVVEIRNGVLSEYVINPEDHGLRLALLKDVIGGTPKENAAIIMGVFSGEIKGPKLDIIALKTASGLYVADKVKSLAEGIEIAKKAIHDGNAMSLITKLRASV